jgi:hypothetical protein
MLPMNKVEAMPIFKGKISKWLDMNGPLQLNIPTSSIVGVYGEVTDSKHKENILVLKIKKSLMIILW